MKTYAFANRKGGCAKSVTTASVGNWLSLNGKKVIMLDLDSQCNLSYAVGFDTVANPDIKTMYDVLSGSVDALDAVQYITADLFGGGAIIPASESLASFDGGMEAMAVSLVDVVKRFSADYDYCLIDTPPSLGKLTVSALMASDEVIVPCMADIFHVQGVQALGKVIEAVKPYNAKLKVSGILLTRNNDRLVLTKKLTDMIDAVATSMNTKVFNAKIREGVVIREASACQMGLFTYDPTCKTTVASDYKEFILELLKGEI